VTFMRWSGLLDGWMAGYQREVQNSPLSCLGRQTVSFVAQIVWLYPRTDFVEGIEQ
jgi:hypothetical protein